MFLNHDLEINKFGDEGCLTTAIQQFKDLELPSRNTPPVDCWLLSIAKR